MNFLNLMNKKAFRVTAAQLVALESATKSLIGEVRVNSLRLSDVKPEGTATLVMGKAKYAAYKLVSNGRWYLSGDYSY